jgi:hypothetical protein
MIQTPIAYIVFNRPQHTERTFAVLREQRPSQLFVIADGPRLGHPADAVRCRAVREIVERVDWPCEVHRNYAKTNLGLKRRVSSGLDWVFGQVERAIVLEDDCVAHPDFFRFCDALLEHYALDERVSVITGNNFQNGRQRGEASYYFSRYNHCWGWATWRRAWQHYQGDLPFWPEWSRSADWCEKTPDAVERRYWEKIFDRVYAGQIDSWAYPWTACVWKFGGLTATPNVNLVSNIGFGEDATHTTATKSAQAELPTQSLGRITHPKLVKRDDKADQWVFEYNFGGRDLRFPRSWFLFPRRAIGFAYRKLKGLIPSFHR